MFRKLPSTTVQDAELSIFIDGEPVLAEVGETVAAVLLRQDPLITRTTPVGNSPRAPYCMMGVCFDCLAIVDGVASTQTCMVSVQAGMRVERQCGRRLASAAKLADVVPEETGSAARSSKKACL